MPVEPDFRIDIEKNFKILKNICEGKDERKRIKAANWMAQNIYSPDIYYLLEKLANENYYCKMQALLIISKIKTPDKKILSILNSLLGDPEYLISMEASKVLSNNIESGNKDLELAKKLLKGGHEAKIRALEIYKNCWKDETKNIISDLNKLIMQERNNFPIFIKIISLLGFIGKKYPKYVIKLFLKIIFDAEISEKKYIFSALSNFAKEHPFEVLSFLSYVEENGDLIVVLFIVVEQKTQKSASTTHHGSYGGYYGRYYGYGPGYGWGPSYSTTTITEYDYKVGTLVVDIFDKKEEKLIWEGIGTRTVDENPQNRDKNIPRSVAAIMSQFPVQPIQE